MPNGVKDFQDLKPCSWPALYNPHLVNFQNVTMPVSAAQPLVGGFNSDGPFREPTRLGSQILATKQDSQAPATQITSASVILATSRLVSQSSTQKSTTTVYAHPVVGICEMPETTGPVKSSVEKLTTTENVDVHQPPLPGSSVMVSTSTASLAVPRL